MSEQAVPAAELAELLSAEQLETYRRQAPEWGCSPIELRGGTPDQGFTPTQVLRACAVGTAAGSQSRASPQRDPD